jgi:hypothetical protein
MHFAISAPRLNTTNALLFGREMRSSTVALERAVPSAKGVREMGMVQRDAGTVCVPKQMRPRMRDEPSELLVASRGCRYEWRRTRGTVEI